MCSKVKATVKNFCVAKSATVKNFRVTAAIPVTRFGGKVLAHSANSIVVSKGTLDDGIKYTVTQTRKNQIDHAGMALILRQVF